MSYADEDATKDQLLADYEAGTPVAVERVQHTVVRVIEHGPRFFIGSANTPAAPAREVQETESTSNYVLTGDRELQSA